MKQKQFAAFFLALVVMFSAMGFTAFADATPTITVVGNESVAPGSDITFDVKLENFSGVKGMDITITSDNGVVFKKITSEEVELTEKNHTLSADEIKIVELNGKPSLVLNVTATVPTDAGVTANISVRATLAASATELVENATIHGGELTTVAVTKAKGTQLRAGGAPYGLRFGLEASCTGVRQPDPDNGYKVDYSGAEVSINGVPRKVLRVGAIVAVADKAKGKELVVEDITKETEAYIKNVEAVKAYNVTNDTVSYVVTVTEILEKAVDKKITVRPYVAYKDDAGEHYTYGTAFTSSVQEKLTAA